MKKIIVLILALAMLVSLVACNGGGDTSKAESKPAVSKADESQAVSTTPVESQDESQPDESKPEVSEVSTVEPPEETQDSHVLTGDGDLLNRNSAFVHIADADGHVSNYGTSPIRFNRWNGEIKPGDTVLITGEEGQKVTEVVTGEFAAMSWWRVIVFEYDMTTYRYKVTQNVAPGEDKSEVVLPKDGFALAIHRIANSDIDESIYTTNFKKVNETNYENGSAYEVGKNVVLVGISALQIHWEATARSAAPVMDGQIKIGEYGDPILTFDGNTPEVDYRNFKAEDKYATGAFYATYDAENLYLAWEISSEHHSNPLDAGSAGTMWQHDCMQIVISTVNPNHSDALNDALSWGGSPSGCGTTAQTKYNTEIGIAVNNDGKTLQCTWWGNVTGFEAKCSRDDTLGKTIYEVKIPLASLNTAFPDHQIEAFEAGVELGVSFSVNTNDGTSRVLRLRDGGGIYGSNDFSKIPVLTLK